MELEQELSAILRLWQFQSFSDDALDVAITRIKDLFGVKHLSPITERQAQFRVKLNTYVEKYGPEFIREFYDYWSQVTERGKNKGLMKYEIAELTGCFKIPNRLATWHKNKQRYSIAGMLIRGGSR